MIGDLRVQANRRGRCRPACHAQGGFARADECVIIRERNWRRNGAGHTVKIDREMVVHIAELAKLQLTDDEIDLYAEQLSDILDYAERLQQLDTNVISPTASVLPLRNVLRDDRIQASLPRDEALAASADTAEGQFRVEAVWDND